MARVDEVKREKLNARQQKLYDDIMRTRPRGSLTGPFSIWIHTPELAEPADIFANCFRVSPKLEKRLIELIILLVCRDATVQYAWSVHEPLGREAGLTPETTDAIRARKRPNFMRDDERLIYDLVTELTATKTLSAASFERAKAALGLERLIEAVTCVGYYGMIGLVLNTFDIPPQPGVPLTP
jgi:4-carboxymuconolactone decarboxylase